MFMGLRPHNSNSKKDDNMDVKGKDDNPDLKGKDDNTDNLGPLGFAACLSKNFFKFP